MATLICCPICLSTYMITPTSRRSQPPIQTFAANAQQIRSCSARSSTCAQCLDYRSVLDVVCCSAIGGLATAVPPIPTKKFSLSDSHLCLLSNTTGSIVCIGQESSLPSFLSGAVSTQYEKVITINQGAPIAGFYVGVGACACCLFFAGMII